MSASRAMGNAAFPLVGFIGWSRSEGQARQLTGLSPVFVWVPPAPSGQ